jgi:hypothetical protein
MRTRPTSSSARKAPLIRRTRPAYPVKHALNLCFCRARLWPACLTRPGKHTPLAALQRSPPHLVSLVHTATELNKAYRLSRQRLLAPGRWQATGGSAGDTWREPPWARRRGQDDSCCERPEHAKTANERDPAPAPDEWTGYAPCTPEWTSQAHRSYVPYAPHSHPETVRCGF